MNPSAPNGGQEGLQLADGAVGVLPRRLAPRGVGRTQSE